MKKAVGGKSRVDLAVDQIIQVILDRNMKAGDKLPNEYDLARELGVGRSTLREAIKRLVARNILTARQGAGTFVSEKNGVPEDPLGLTFMMEEGSENLALDLQDIRLMLEPETCAIVARGATPEQIDQLRELVDRENLPVLCFGLRTDFQTKLFPGSRRLFELADSITEIKTICDCGRKATTNARISPDGYVITEGDQVFLGGNDSYIAMCHKCYQDYINEHRKVELLHGTERDPQ